MFGTTFGGSKVMSEAIVVAVLLLVSCGEEASKRLVVPDRILANARVVTMDRNESIVEALAIQGHRIVALGTTAEISALAGPGTEVIDLHGKTVTPGLIDAHNHFAWGALGEMSPLDIEYPAVSSIEDIRKQIAVAVAGLQSEEWIVGSNWDAGKLYEQRDIVAADLDDITPENPVWLLHTSAHYGVANSLALELAGIDASTPDPDGGVIARDDAGNPTGILADQAMNLVVSITPEVTTEDFVEAITERVSGLSAEGITTIKDPEIDQRHWDAYQAVKLKGDLSVRVFTLWRVPDTMTEARELLQHIKPLTHPGTGAAGSELVSGGVKIYIDGSGTARTAWMYDDWNENFSGTDEGNTGLTYLQPDLLLDEIRLFHNAGIHIGTHAIGDRAIDFTLDAYDRVIADNPISGLRHSIIHCNIPTEHALDLMVKLQRDFDSGYPEIQPAFLWWIGDAYAANFGPERSLRVLPLRTFRDKGIKWAGSSDFDVSPYAPRYAIWAAVTREAMLGTHGSHPWGTVETISVHDVLKAYTNVAARQVFMEDSIGSIEVGKLADIVAWNRDPYSIQSEALKEMKPVMTLMNGEVVYRATNSGE
jgi:predicted amidohydrolase YtcJ